MGHRELGDYYWSVGDYLQSLKHYNKSREFCTTNQHVLEYSLTSLQLLLEHCDYSHIGTYIFKAEAAFAPPEGSKETGKKSSIVHPPGSAAAAAAASAAANPEREKAQAKIDCANGIAFMAQGHYEKAAFSFSKLNRSLDDWLGPVSFADV
jgi:COP9 signalosome complex subunit 1